MLKRTRHININSEKGGQVGLPGIGIGPDFGDGQNSVSFTVGTVSLSATTTDILASKDTWIPNVAGCIDDANKNGTNLQIEGIVATRKDTYIGWDLSSYPTGATVSAATLRHYVTTATLADVTVTLNHLADGNEGWSETGLVCSGALGLTAAQTVAGGFLNSTGEHATTLNSTMQSRIDDRMGAGNYSIVVTSGAVATNGRLQSKDSGGSPGNASGPRLSFSWTKTL